jgi:hypothetical protein
VRCEFASGKWFAALSAVLLIAFACAAPKNVNAVTSPPPSQSPTPTAPLQASGPGFHGGEVGIAFAPIALTATGGLARYTWTVSSGALPPGLILGGDGGISGTPTGGGADKFTIQLSDSSGRTSTIDGGISIADRLTAHLNPSCAQYCDVELGCADACGDFGSLSGGVQPITFSLAGGTLPAGTSLNGFSLKGTFRGGSGYLKFTVQATDGLGATTAISPTFWMYDHISLAGGTCTGRGKCSVTVTYSGGTPGPLPTVAPTAWAGANCVAPAPYPCPEPLFAASYLPGQVTIVLTYGANYPATFGTMTLTITDNSLCAPRPNAPQAPR